VTIHAEKFNRGEWHAYVMTKDSGWEYPGADIFLSKEEAEAELKRLMEGE